MTVQELHDSLAAVMLNGEGTLPVLLQVVEQGGTRAQQIVCAMRAQDYDGDLFWVIPTGKSLTYSEFNEKKMMKLTASRVARWLWQRDGKPDGRAMGEVDLNHYVRQAEDVFEAIRVLGYRVSPAAIPEKVRA